MSAACKICHHKKCFICRFATPEWKEIIGRQRQIIEAKKGQQIIFEGSTITGIYFICSGKVKVFRQIQKNTVQIIRYANAGAMMKIMLFCATIRQV